MYYDLHNIILGVVCAVVGCNNGEMNASTFCSIPTTIKQLNILMKFHILR